MALVQSRISALDYDETATTQNYEATTTATNKTCLLFVCPKATRERERPQYPHDDEFQRALEQVSLQHFVR